MTAQPTPTVEDYEAALTAVGLHEMIRCRTTISTRRRTLGLDVVPDTTVAVTVPAGTDPALVAAAVKRHTDWIIARILDARRAGTVANHQPKQLVAGEGFTLHGTNHILHVCHDPAARTVRLDRIDSPTGSYPRLFLPVDQAGDNIALIDWYTRHGTELLNKPTMAPLWFNRFGAHDLRLVIEDLGDHVSRFRPSSSTIAFHWAAFQLPQVCLELELARHAARHDGGRRLSASAAEQKVKTVLPDWEYRLDRLRKNWTTAWTGALAPLAANAHRPPEPGRPCHRRVPQEPA